MQYWLNSSTLPLEELVIRIGLFYYSSNIEKSNVYLIATLVRKLNTNGFDLTLERLEALAKRPSLSGFKFFSEEEDSSAVKGKVQIMTLHKSKGDEFEYVFIPELTEKALSIDVAKATIKSSTTFMEQVRGFAPNYKIKSEIQLKEFSAEESLRLFYVAITRAKKKLYITSSLKTKSFGKETSQEPSIVFEKVLD
jgi:superfamily I DNA/RNA helicase